MRSSFKVEIFDLLILPINLNFDNLGYSFKTIFNEMESSFISSYSISISEKRFCCQSLLIAELISLPGILIFWLIFNEVISKIFDLLTNLVPTIFTFDKTNSFGFV